MTTIETVGQAVLLVNVLSTWTMLGVILIVQFVHYPLFTLVGEAQFAAYLRQHQHRITWIVFPAMSLELVSAVLLIVYAPSSIPAWSAVAGLALVASIWLSTAFVQVPHHRRLSTAFSTLVIRRLVRSNGLRTAAWALRSGLVAWMLWLQLIPEM